MKTVEVLIIDKLDSLDELILVCEDFTLTDHVVLSCRNRSSTIDNIGILSIKQDDKLEFTIFCHISGDSCMDFFRITFSLLQSLFQASHFKFVQFF